MPAAAVTLAQARDIIEDETGVCLPMSTMYSMAENGRGPKTFKFNGRIYLRRSEIDHWIDSELAGAR